MAMYHASSRAVESEKVWPTEGSIRNRTALGFLLVSTDWSKQYEPKNMRSVLNSMINYNFRAYRLHCTYSVDGCHRGELFDKGMQWGTDCSWARYKVASGSARTKANA